MTDVDYGYMEMSPTTAPIMTDTFLSDVYNVGSLSLKIQLGRGAVADQGELISHGPLQFVYRRFSSNEEKSL